MYSRKNISSLHQRHRVAAATVLYKMHTCLCPPDLKAFLPQPYVVRRATRSSLSMPYAMLWQCLPPEESLLGEPRSSTLQSKPGTACLMMWLVGNILDNGRDKSRVYKHLILSVYGYQVFQVWLPDLPKFTLYIYSGQSYLGLDIPNLFRSVI